MAHVPRSIITSDRQDFKASWHLFLWPAVHEPLTWTSPPGAAGYSRVRPTFFSSLYPGPLLYFSQESPSGQGCIQSQAADTWAAARQRPGSGICKVSQKRKPPGSTHVEIRGRWRCLVPVRDDKIFSGEAKQDCSRCNEKQPCYYSSAPLQIHLSWINSFNYNKMCSSNILLQSTINVFSFFLFHVHPDFLPLFSRWRIGKYP